MANPWRYRCPEGHASLRLRDGPTYRCESCGQTYRGEPVDVASEAADTTSAEPLERIHPLTAVRRFHAALGEHQRTARARQVSDRPAAFGTALSIARERGLVERVAGGDYEAARWRLTDAGRQLCGDAPAEVEA